LTMNTLLQGAWGLLLSRHSGRDDVLFGGTVSGVRRSCPVSRMWSDSSSTPCRCECGKERRSVAAVVEGFAGAAA
jgi:hypothetical protein